MIRRAVLWALAQAAEAGEGDEGALARLRVDPVLAGRARKLLRTAVVEALIDAPGAEGAQLARRAYLIVAAPRGARVAAIAAPEDEATVAARFAAARAAAGPAPRVSYLASALCGLLGLAVAGALGFALYRAAHPGPKDAWHRRAGEGSAPGSRLAAAPPRVPADVAALFQQDLVKFLLQLDRLTDAIAREGTAAARVIGGQVETAASEAEARCATVLPDPACARFATLLAAARQVGEQGGEPAEQAFLEAVGRFDDELAAAGVAVYVDGDLITEGSGRRHVVLYSFSVEKVHERIAAAHPVRALWLRRLDLLNFEQAAAGFVRPNLREALVLLDQTEGELSALVLPGLVDGGRVDLSPGEDAQYPGREALEKLAAASVRREWTAALGAGEPGLARVAARLGRREAILDQLERQLHARGLVLGRPTGLRLPDGWAAQLRAEVPHDSYDELVDLDEELASEAAAAAYAAGRDVLAALIETHEVQHRLDVASSGLRMPPELEAIVGPALFEGEVQGGAAAARDEMSAYLAQLARTPALAATSLVLTARFLLDRRLWGGAECQGALVIFAGLARELGLPAEKYVVQGFVDRGAVARTLTALLGKDGAEVAAAAKRLWEHLYGAALEPLR